MKPLPEVAQLTEYTPLRLPSSALRQDEGERFWQRYGRFVAVELVTEDGRPLAVDGAGLHIWRCLRAWAVVAAENTAAQSLSA
ncbi:MAG: hypothetical protein R2856_12320 [Caldilineaceae bacterium]